MKTAVFGVLSFSLSTVAGGVISTTASLYIPPASGVLRDAFGPRKQDLAPTPAPATTDHYAASSYRIAA